MAIKNNSIQVYSVKFHEDQLIYLRMDSYTSIV